MTKATLTFDQIALALVGGRKFLDIWHAIHKLSLGEELDSAIDQQDEASQRKAALRASKRRHDANVLCVALDTLERDTRAERLRLIAEMRATANGTQLCIDVLHKLMTQIPQMRMDCLTLGTSCYLSVYRYTIVRIQELAIYISEPVFDALTAILNDPVSQAPQEQFTAAANLLAKQSVMPTSARIVNQTKTSELPLSSLVNPASHIQQVLIAIEAGELVSATGFQKRFKTTLARLRGKVNEWKESDLKIQVKKVLGQIPT